MTNPNRPALFAAKVRPLPSGCWQWTGAIDKTGYGRFRIDGGRTQAARRCKECAAITFKAWSDRRKVSAS